MLVRHSHHPATGRPHNRALRALLAEINWTEDELARRVNRVAAESGLVLRLDRRSISHWLAGRRPRQPLPQLVAEAFSRELRRTVTIDDVCLGPHDSGRESLAASPMGPQTGPDQEIEFFHPRDVVGMLTHLAQYDGDRRRALVSGAYSLTLLTVPGWAAALHDHGDHSSKAGPAAGRPLASEQVVTVEQMTRVFSDADTAFGGGRARTALIAYLASDIAPRLRDPADWRLRRRMLSAATQLTYLAGFMCFDDECHGLGQRYYRTALRLAAENNDPVGYAVTLRAMSVQARLLGHHQHAEQLAESAATTSRSATDPVRRAFFLGQLAVATAATGNRRHAVSALSAAERGMERATSLASDMTDNAPMGGYHPAALQHQQAAVRALLGDRKGAIIALRESIRHRPSHERRSRAITNARLAELYLEQGHLEKAIAAWQSFLEDYPHLSSGRATTALSNLRSRLLPHSSHPAARQLLAQAAAA